MANYVYMVNEAEHRFQKVKVGFSWTMLFFTWVFALPLFLRRVFTWAIGVLIFIAVSYYVELFYFHNEPIISFHLKQQGIMHFAYYISFLNHWSGTAMVFISLYLGFKGNEITGRYYLNHGWDFADPESPEAEYARHRWHMPTQKIKI